VDVVVVVVMVASTYSLASVHPLQRWVQQLKAIIYLGAMLMKLSKTSKLVPLVHILPSIASSPKSVWNVVMQNTELS
jgi:hypothetical protein